MDEALSVGDVFFQNKCYRKFEDFKKQGKTILFVSHDLSSISKYCDRVILLEKGAKIGEGEPKEIIDMYKKVLVHQLDAQKEERAKQTTLPKKAQSSWKDQMVLNPDLDEYGNELAKFIDFCALDADGNISNSLIKGEACTIRVKVRFFDKIQDPIIAVSFKNRMGVEITGTNTMFEKMNTGTPGPGEVYIYDFKQNMDLQGGEYLISLGCVGYRDGEFTVYHRMYDLFSINVISSKDSVGYYDMNTEIIIEKVV